jgi:hypothetical protein
LDEGGVVLISTIIPKFSQLSFSNASLSQESREVSPSAQDDKKQIFHKYKEKFSFTFYDFFTEDYLMFRTFQKKFKIDNLKSDKS